MSLTTKDTYPVLYVLDGENCFRSVTAVFERLIESRVIPPMIVIGIPNTNIPFSFLGLLVFKLQVVKNSWIC
ncbi:alpha/beta hydrolase-fold protein [Adhaeribacter aquaticus]|uniref:alpha/beta hydrolase-fold protein n=1 Tax=Adhaeribacter aquaticus TaxID=299567 RepID=UPI0012FC02B1